MEAHGLRVYAGPFDWVFSDARMVTHCLVDGFASFLDRQQMRLNGGKPSHALYGPMTRHRTIFNHHNPLESEEHHAHFVRCAARLNAVLACPQPKLLLLVSKPATQQPKRLDLAAVRGLFEALCERSSRFELLVVALECSAKPFDNVPLPEAVLIDEADVHQPSCCAALRVWRLRCRGGHTGLAFEDDGDAARYEEIVLAAPAPARQGGDARICADTEPRAAAAPAAATAVQRRRFDLAADPLPPRQQGQGGAAAAEPHVVGLPHLDRPSKKLVTYLLKREAEGSSSSSSKS